ncbi:MAG TPA: malto-oligosyltrehalose trehalohydrolase [Chitinophagaceae bacterium]|jgi:maltooligosyltrehalose trehalohydrolase|nr:malto-oligosyltrehalose trehalohydrolase [Chitinophagaceae bacterium]
MIPVDIKKRSVGVTFSEGGTAEVAVWAPEATRVELELSATGRLLPLQPAEEGYWTGRTDELKPGDPYRFRLNEDQLLPDPASLAQPEDVHGPSAAVDTARFAWTDSGWNNLPLDDYILYELHTGTFSPEGNFAGIEARLGYLKELGVTAIEIMPIAQFPGARNWGYDGVYPFAAHTAYGGAEGLQRLVNACHEKGLAVVLDVVYNHFGPEGNYLDAYGPYFTDKYKTPWGRALNFDDTDCDAVRKYFIENALMWLRDFHIDALRLDAVHAIKDFSAVHLLQEIRHRVAELESATGRRHYLIAELDLNDTRFIAPPERGGFGLDAQWIDEFHHALRVTAGGDRSGYYSDFNGIRHLAKSFNDAYVYDGQYSPHRRKRFGIPAREHPGRQFVVFSQNHDQVGNRMLGERTSTLHSFEMQKLLAGAVLLSPYLPMLFMGEEWGEPNPFLYFVSHTDAELAEAVRQGRKAEFAAFHAEGEAPDPVSEDTFLRSKLQWPLTQEEPHATLLRYYRTLIGLRTGMPALRGNNRRQLHVECNEEWNTLMLHRWEGPDNVIALMNFSDRPQHLMLPSHVERWHKVLDSAAPQWKGPQEAPGTVSGGNPGAAALTLQPESLIVYASAPVRP